MRFGSVCSGIEAASVAWAPLGWEAAWFSEIEPFPCAVLAHHYPDVPNLGDMTTLPDRIRAGEVEAPDIFCGGTPCQAFSVAGQRKSLDDARGNLSLTFCEIADAIDEQRTEPAIIFWENVPGVLNTKDNAFGCFLGKLAGEDCALEPTGGKWSYAGCVYGPKRTVAWRILDAQYFGVAQRRRRVFVIASARDGFDPCSVLFEFDGLRRDTAPRREAGEEVAGTFTARAKSGGWGQDPNLAAGGYMRPVTFDRQSIGEYGTASVASTVSARDYKGATDLVSYGIPGNWIGRKPENGGNAVEPMHDVAPCLTKTDRHGVAQPMPINTMVALRHNALGRGTGFGIGDEGDPAYTITKGHSHAVAQPVAYGVGESPDTAHCLRSGASKADKHESTTYVAQPMAFQSSQSGVRLGDTHATLDANNGPRRHNGVMQGMAVRRLTPVECERLQGFPDNYTNIPWRKKPESPDGPRYKALGNSWAVPVVRWIGWRIALNLL